MTNRRGGSYRPITIGRCFACGLPVTNVDVVSIRDDAAGVWRKVHREACADRLRVQLGPTIEGSER